MENIHTIKANLYKNRLSEDNTIGYKALPVDKQRLTIRRVCDAIVYKGGSSMSAPFLQYATEMFLEEMVNQLCNGFSVETDYFTVYPVIDGVFENSIEVFNPDKHTLFFQFNQGEKLLSKIPTIEIDIQGLVEDSVEIMQVIDVKSGSMNDLLTPGRNLNIEGKRIKIAGENRANGIYFIETSTQTKTKVDATDIVINNASEIIIIIPELSTGTYTLELVTQYTQQSMLKFPLVISFGKSLRLV